MILCSFSSTSKCRWWLMKIRRWWFWISFRKLRRGCCWFLRLRLVRTIWGFFRRLIVEENARMASPGDELYLLILVQSVSDFRPIEDILNLHISPRLKWSTESIFLSNYQLNHQNCCQYVISVDSAPVILILMNSPLTLEFMQLPVKVAVANASASHPGQCIINDVIVESF